jgi:hypothetical protein
MKRKVCEAREGGEEEGGGRTIAISARMKAMAWCSMIGLPIVFRVWAYMVASSRARWASPTAAAATSGLVMSNAPIAVLNPCPGVPMTFSSYNTDERTHQLNSNEKHGRGKPKEGTNRNEDICERDHPRIRTLLTHVDLLLPDLDPLWGGLDDEAGHSLGGWDVHVGLGEDEEPWGSWWSMDITDQRWIKLNTLSDRRWSEGFIFIPPALVIHIFDPLSFHPPSTFSAFVFIPATSDPAPGSVTLYRTKVTNLSHFRSGLRRRRRQ